MEESLCEAAILVETGVGRRIVASNGLSWRWVWERWPGLAKPGLDEATFSLRHEQRRHFGDSTGDNEVVDTIHASSSSVAVASDGKHVYVFGPSTSDFVFNISVIDATNDSVVATIPLDVSLIPEGRSLNETSGAIAVTPDGKHIYATTGICPFFDSPVCGTPEDFYFALWEIDAGTNKVVAASMPFVGNDNNEGKGLADGIAFYP
jgi:hypothetical protein